MNLNEWAKEIHNYAKEKGWWSGRIKTPTEVHMLTVTELAEAVEEIRKGTPEVYVENREGLPVPVTNLVWESFVHKEFVNAPNIDPVIKYLKPEGEAVEVADAIIRLLDYAGYRGWDIEAIVQIKHNYNKTRSARHGGKLL